jgi:hypothetical protein
VDLSDFGLAEAFADLQPRYLPGPRLIQVASVRDRQHGDPGGGWHSAESAAILDPAGLIRVVMSMLSHVLKGSVPCMKRPFRRSTVCSWLQKRT